MIDGDPKPEVYSETEIGAKFKELVDSLRTDQNDFRFDGPYDHPDGSRFWDFHAESIGGSTLSAQVRFYANRNEFSGDCLGEFSFDNLQAVLARLNQKFSPLK